MRVLVLGADGYLGWPTSLYLSARGFEVGVMDNFSRRTIDDEIGSQSLVPIKTLRERVDAWHRITGKELRPYIFDLTDYQKTLDMIEDFRPDAIVHFAEQRAAPYSMIDRDHAVYTQVNNVVGTLNVIYAIAHLRPDCHLVKLGTMGEYGTPNIDIEEGFIEVTHNGRTDVLPYPKQPGSFYHLSKVHDSHNIMFSCKNFGLRSTDLNQGIVYGHATDETRLDEDLATRFDYDGVYGTVLNRFAIQAVIGHALTVYGQGGQTRGMLDIRDTVRCIEIACMNPPEEGEYRVFNQFTEEFSVGDLAERVQRLRPGTVIEHLPNPRTEANEHYYKAVNTHLLDLGLEPHFLSDELILEMFDLIERYRDRVIPANVNPGINWRQTAKDGPVWPGLFEQEPPRASGRRS